MPTFRNIEYTVEPNVDRSAWHWTLHLGGGKTETGDDATNATATYQALKAIDAVVTVTRKHMPDENANAWVSSSGLRPPQ